MPGINLNIYSVFDLERTETCWQSPAKITGKVYLKDQFKCDFVYYVAIDAFQFPDYIKDHGVTYFSAILRGLLSLPARWDGKAGRNPTRASRRPKTKTKRRSSAGVRPGVAA